MTELLQATLRPLLRRDIPKVIEILLQNNSVTYERAQESYLKQLDDRPDPSNLVAKDFVICLGGTLIGTIGYRKRAAHYLITWFYIAKEYQGKGYGSKAFSEIESMIAKDGPCEIRLKTAFPKASAFYLKRNYELIATEQDRKILRKMTT